MHTHIVGLFWSDYHFKRDLPSDNKAGHMHTQRKNLHIQKTYKYARALSLSLSLSLSLCYITGNARTRVTPRPRVKGFSPPRNSQKSVSKIYSYTNLWYYLLLRLSRRPWQKFWKINALEDFMHKFIIQPPFEKFCLDTALKWHFSDSRSLLKW